MCCNRQCSSAGQLSGKHIRDVRLSGCQYAKEGLCKRDELESGKDVELTNIVLDGIALKDRIVTPTNLI